MINLDNLFEVRFFPCPIVAPSCLLPSHKATFQDLLPFVFCHLNGLYASLHFGRSLIFLCFGILYRYFFADLTSSVLTLFLFKLFAYHLSLLREDIFLRLFLV